MLQGSFKKHAKQAIPAYIILTIIIIVASVNSRDFASAYNISNVISQSAPIAIVAIGQSLVILIGGIDLSVGSVVSLSTIIMARFSPDSAIGLVIGILVCLIAGSLTGLANGFGIMRLNIAPMIMTLATMAAVKGVALYLQSAPGGKVHYGFMSFLTTKFGFFNTLGIFIVVFYFVIIFVLARTRFGRNIYATGGNIESARKIGVPVEKTYIMTYMLSGIFASVGGMFLSANMYSADPIVGDPYSLDTITAVILGGTLLTGGVGGVLGTLGGVFLISMIGNMLNMLGVFPYYQYIVKGLILVLALFITVFIKRKER